LPEVFLYTADQFVGWFVFLALVDGKAPPLFIFFAGTLRQIAFCFLRPLHVAGWLWRVPLAEQQKF